MPQVHLDEETVGRLDALRVDGEEYDAIVGGLIDSCEAEGIAPLGGTETSDRSSGVDETTRDEGDANGDA